MVGWDWWFSWTCFTGVQLTYSAQLCRAQLEFPPGKRVCVTGSPIKTLKITRVVVFSPVQTDITTNSVVS